MKGSPAVIDMLNALLENELAAIDQYFIHSRMYEDFGLNKLYERMNHEMDEEKGHCDAIIKRILFLEGKPNLSKRRDILVGEHVEQMLANDLVLELEVVTALKAGIELCENENDYETREMLNKLLFDTEEDHVYWLEQQLSLIKKIGIQNYVQSQM